MDLVNKLAGSIFALIFLFLLLNLASGSNQILNAIGSFNVGLINTLQGQGASSNTVAAMSY